MYVKFLGVKGTWREIANSANTTINKEEGEREPSSRWKLRILRSEHSPIRQLIIKWKWYDLKRWVSDHFVRHKFGIEHWVKTDRSDRTGINRDELSQSSYTIHESEANAQAIINISRKRLCNCASQETREAWRIFLETLKDIEPELYRSCVRECVYRNGFCPEFNTCKYNKTEEFEKELTTYIEGFEKQINDKTNISIGVKSKCQS